MNAHTNPFVRGYQNLRFNRVLMILCEADPSPYFLPLHSCQTWLPDERVHFQPCVFGDKFALIAEGHRVPDNLLNKCQRNGVVRTILYAITADDFGTPVHVGYTYSAEAARQVVSRLRFETGLYSRCWEISSTHLPRQAMDYLEDVADTNASRGLLFSAFRLPVSYAVGCKLLWTPWTSESLRSNASIDVDELRQKQLRVGVPEVLVNLLHLAAQADVRFLILDPDASVLKELPVYSR